MKERKIDRRKERRNERLKEGKKKRKRKNERRTRKIANFSNVENNELLSIKEGRCKEY